MNKQAVTIDDVAKAAGVARVTVSRVLNNVANVRTETRQRVRNAIETLGYSVNQQARALASGSGREIMLVRVHDPEREPNSYYHAGLELGALRGCSALGLDLVTRAIDPRAESPSRLLSAYVERERPFGIILSPPLSDDVELIMSTRASGVGIVAIAAGERARTIVNAVGIDERGAGAAVAQHLLELGHRQFGFLKGPPEHRAAALRYDGFIDALRAAGVHDGLWTSSGDFTFRSGAGAAEQMLRERAPVTALACANDDMAAGAMLALHRAGLELPSAMSVTGFDDTPMSEVVWPPLTTIRQPIQFFGERAVRILGDLSGRDDPEAHFEAVEHRLIVRESTAPPNKFRAA